MDKENVFSEWCIVEMLGHRKLAGLVTERVIAGKGFLQVQVPNKAGEMQTQLIPPESVYCITPTEAQICRKVAESCEPTTISKWDLRQLLAPPKEQQMTFYDHYDEDSYDAEEMEASGDAPF